VPSSFVKAPAVRERSSIEATGLSFEVPEATTEDRTERTDAVWWCRYYVFKRYYVFSRASCL